MHTLALPKSVLCIEPGPPWPLAHYELAHLIKKKIDAVVLRLCSAAPRRLTPGDDHNVVLQPFNPIFQTMVRFWIRIQCGFEAVGCWQGDRWGGRTCGLGHLCRVLLGVAAGHGHCVEGLCVLSPELYIRLRWLKATVFSFLEQ